MFADDFIFNNKRLSDFGLMIGNVDGENNESSGGDIEYNFVKTPNRDSFNYYGRQLNSQLEWNFTIIKSPCLQDELKPFTQYEESRIAKWLLSPDKDCNWIQFDQDGWRDVYYKVVFQMKPHMLHGETHGYDVTVTSDCGYGWSEEKNISKTLSFGNPITFTLHSDMRTYIFPKIHIVGGNGNFYISNDSDEEQCELYGEKSSHFYNIEDEIYMDSDNCIIDGIIKPDDFNYYYLRLIDGKNVITTDSDTELTIDITYREPRRAIV